MAQQKFAPKGRWHCDPTMLIALLLALMRLGSGSSLRLPTRDVGEHSISVSRRSSQSSIVNKESFVIPFVIDLNAVEDFFDVTTAGLGAPRDSIVVFSCLQVKLPPFSEDRILLRIRSHPLSRAACQQNV
jgi:hypothetical protein